MKSILKVLVATGLMMFSTSSLGNLSEGVFVNLGLGYDSHGQEIVVENTTSGAEETTKEENSEMIINFTGAYSLGNGFLVGVKYYSVINGYSEDDNGTTNDWDNDSSTMGFLGGYSMDGFLVMGSYMLIDPPSDKRSFSNGNEWEYSDGSGLILDFSYMFDLGGFQVGPQLSYVSFSYDKLTVNETEVETFVSRTDSWIKPQFAVSAIF